MKNSDGNLIFERTPAIASYASVVGKKEGEGPLRDHFDRIIHDSYAGKDTFEQAESELMSAAVQQALNNGSYRQEEIDLACCGDLLNQCVASSFAMRSYAIPYAGVYGACSTMGLSMILSAIAVESGAAHRAVCAASSHYCTAERQYRFPLEYGSQRPPTAQWTVTGSGACVIERRNLGRPQSAVMMQESDRTDPDSNSSQRSRGSDRTDPDSKLSRGNRGSERTAPDSNLSRGNRGSERTAPDSNLSQRSRESDLTPSIHAARLGRIVDYRITDQNNMGAAMAPAVVKIGTIIILLFSENFFSFVRRLWTNTAISCMMISETGRAGEGFEACGCMDDRFADGVHRDPVFGRKRLLL